jgi:hypothetical protein
MVAQEKRNGNSAGRKSKDAAPDAEDLWRLMGEVAVSIKVYAELRREGGEPPESLLAIIRGFETLSRVVDAEGTISNWQALEDKLDAVGRMLPGLSTIYQEVLDGRLEGMEYADRLRSLVTSAHVDTLISVDDGISGLRAAKGDIKNDQDRSALQAARSRLHRLFDLATPRTIKKHVDAGTLIGWGLKSALCEYDVLRDYLVHASGFSEAKVAKVIEILNQT